MERDANRAKVWLTTSWIEHWPAMAQGVQATVDTVTVDLADGRSISVPIPWYPRLATGTPAERRHWRFIGRGERIHWPDLDEDSSVENLLSGARSGESQRSFKQWLAARAPATERCLLQTGDWVARCARIRCDRPLQKPA